MIKNVKSLLFWSVVYKFKKRLSLVVVLLAVVLLSQWIYADIVEYLKLTQKVQYLSYILPAKWGVIFFNIGLSAYLILTMFSNAKSAKKSKKAKKQEKRETKKVVLEKNSTTLSERERSFLTKKLRSEAEILMQNSKVR